MANISDSEISIRDVEYQRIDGKPWPVRIYQPKGSGPFPAIIDVHGGAWHNGDRTNNEGIDKALAAHGILVAAIEFRQPPEASYPASVCDINLATRWLKAHAAAFNCSTTVGAFGNSSGGHQVVLSALRPRHAAYTALPLAGNTSVDASLAYVIAGWPVICPLYRFRYAKEINHQDHIKAHYDFWGTEEAMWEGSPQSIVEQGTQECLPPIFMMLKANDKNHPLPMEEKFIATYRQRGGSIDAETFAGLPEHRMVPSPERPDTLRAMQMMIDFIRKHAA